MKTRIRTGSIILQWIISILLITFVWSFFSFAMEDASDDYRGDTSLEHYLDRGEYGHCMEFYHILKANEEADTPRFEGYKEFVEFYENYMYYIQYEQYEIRLATGEYEEKRIECMENMKSIAENTTFFENEPHYEYLFTTLQQDD